MADINVTVRVDTRQLDQLQTSLKKGYTLNVNGATGVSSDMKKVSTATQEATRSVSDFGNAIVSKVKWGVIQTSLRAIADSFRMAIDNMKEVDTQITNVAKVTGQSIDQLQGMADKAYSTASKYGVTAGQYMEAVYEYTKAGFQDNADVMAELSTKAMLVGDTTAGIADKFLIAGNAAFGFGGNVEKLSLMIDQADYINNKYATTLEKIAEGFPRVASVANMAGMTAEETMAALGTITATTQETASRASTALRALIINILGDTNTEIEDGVTATEESISGLRDALAKYAPEVVKAADATGKLINPMEALKSLSEAYIKGDLTERGLFAIETALGGKLRTNQLDALLKNFGEYEKMLAGMGGAAGTADQEISTMLESWEAKTKILENTWTEFVAKTFDSSMFKGMIDGVTQLLKLFGDFGHLLVTISGAAFFVKFAKSATNLTKELSRLDDVIGPLKIKMVDMIHSGAARDSSGKLTESYKALRTELQGLQAEYDKTAQRAQFMNRIALGIGIATTAFSVITMIVNAVKQAREEYLAGLAEERDAAINDATTAKEEANSLIELYQQYVNIKTAYEEGRATKEEYLSISEQLAKILGVETMAVDSLAQSYDKLTIAQLNAKKEELERARLRAKQYFIEANSGRALFGEGITSEYDPDSVNPAYGAAAWEEANKLQIEGHDDEWLQQVYRRTKAYQTVLDTYEKESKGSVDYIKTLSKERQKAIEDARKWFSDLEEYGLNEYIQAEDAVRDIEETIRQFESGELIPETADAEKIDDATAALKRQMEAYDSLAEKIEKANVALDNYNAAIQEQQGDEYKKYVDAYESFLTDWEKGFKGSTNVLAAEELFFTNEQIIAMRKKGVDVGEILASDFYQSLFTHMEEDGRQFNKEDMGAYALYSMFDDTSGTNLVEGYKRVGNEIRDVNDELVASFTSTFDEHGNESVSLMVESFDKLGQALNIDPSFLASFFEAIGVYDPALEENAQSIMEIADSVGALHQNAASLDVDGVIDVSQMFKGLGEAGKQANELYRYFDRLKELQASGELSLDMDLNTEEGAKKVDELIGKYAAADDEPLNVDPETDEAEEKVTHFVSWASDQVITPGIDMQMGGAYQAMRDFVNSNWQINVKVKKDEEASGTRNAPGGLTLVNEGGGPEIIVEDGVARIAGGGKPALTILQKGATVFNADDTRKIFERSGINAFEDGTVTLGSYKAEGVTRPSGTEQKEEDSSGSDSGSYSGNTQETTTRQPQTGINKDTLDSLKKAVELQKSYLELAEAQNASAEEQLKWRKAIAEALLNEIQYLKDNGGDQKEINNLLAEYHTLLSDTEEFKIEQFDKEVSLLESQLEILEARDASTKSQILKEREIMDALQRQIKAMKEAKRPAEEINKIREKYYETQKKIKQLEEDLLSRLSTAAQNRIDKINEKRQQELDKLKEAYDVKSKQNELEEKELALAEAKEKLANARAERNVRVWDAAKGQWKWVANAQNVESAKEGVKSARDSLADYKRQQRYEAAEARVNAKYDALVEPWQKVVNRLAEPAESLGKVFRDLGKNATKAMGTTIKAINRILRKTGFQIDTKNLYDSGGVLQGMGGIKATSANEMILPPDLTKAMLTPVSTQMFNQRVSELRSLYGATTGMNAGNNTSVGKQINGGTFYQYGDITLTEAQAKTTTIYDLAKMAKGLRSYVATAK